MFSGIFQAGRVVLDLYVQSRDIPQFGDTGRCAQPDHFLGCQQNVRIGKRTAACIAAPGGYARRTIRDVCISTIAAREDLLCHPFKQKYASSPLLA